MAMKEVEVALEIMSSELGLSEISSCLGCSYSSGSYDRGARHGDREPSPITVWRFDSLANRSASALEHFKDIATRLPGNLVRMKSMAIKDMKIRIQVAVYFDTAMCTVDLSSECIDIAKNYGSGVEVTCYPTKFESSK
jgi:hypothetical protein